MRADTGRLATVMGGQKAVLAVPLVDVAEPRRGGDTAEPCHQVWNTRKRLATASIAWLDELLFHGTADFDPMWGIKFNDFP